MIADYVLKGAVVSLAAASLAIAFPAGAGIIGGDDVIRIDEDFLNNLPNVDLRIPGLSRGTGQIDPRAANLGTAVEVRNLGAALSQAIGASNRPSVLTPYVGTLPTGPGQEEVYDSFGSIVTNKASTIGKGKFAIGFSYQHTRFTEFNGDPIGKFASFVARESVSEIIADNIAGSDVGAPTVPLVDLRLDGTQEIELRVSNVSISADVIILSLTYGLLDRLDVGALIPYIFLETHGKARVSVTNSGTVSIINDATGAVIDPSFRQVQPREVVPEGGKGDWDEDFDGFGDMILFAKLQILSQAGVLKNREGVHTPAPLDLAVQVELKLPTGDEDEFIGTGKTDVSFRLIVQREFDIREQLIRARGELGFSRSGLGNDFNALEYKAGLEWEVLPGEFALSAELIASDSRAFDQIIGAVLGAKYVFPLNPYLDAIFGGVRFPVNNNGLQARYSPIIGIEKTFDTPFSRTEQVASLGPRDLPEFEPIADPIAVAPVQAARTLEPPIPAPALSEQTRPALPDARPAPPPAATEPAAAAKIPQDYRIPVRGPSLPRDPSDPLPLPRGRNYSGPPSDR